MRTKELEAERVIVLRKPVQFADQAWSEMRLREPTPREFIAVEAMSGTERTINLIFGNCGLPIGAIEKIGARDLGDARDYLMAFAAAPAISPPDAYPEDLVVTLRSPVVWRDTEYRDLPLREPTAGELAKIDRYSGLRTTTHLIALVADLPVEAVERIAMRDFTEAQSYLLGFITGARETGAPG